MKKAVIDEILLPGDLSEQQAQEEKVRSGFKGKLIQFASRIPFSHDLVSAYYCALDRETPTQVRGTLLAALAYFILPLDMVPDFIAGFGITDDITVLGAAITMVNNHIKDHHREAARKFLEQDDPES